jgi:hypothetical protein
MEWPVGLLCSRNAHARKVLVGRAQWEPNRPPSREEKAGKRRQGSLEGSFEWIGVARCAQVHPFPRDTNGCREYQHPVRRWSGRKLDVRPGGVQLDDGARVCDRTDQG